MVKRFEIFKEAWVSRLAFGKILSHVPSSSTVNRFITPIGS